MRLLNERLIRFLLFFLLAVPFTGIGGSSLKAGSQDPKQGFSKSGRSCTQEELLAALQDLIQSDPSLPFKSRIRELSEQILSDLKNDELTRFQRGLIEYKKIQLERVSQLNGKELHQVIEEAFEELIKERGYYDG